MQAPEAVEVLQLGLGTQPRRAAPTQAHVAVAAHRTPLQRAVRDAQRTEDLAKLLHKEARLLGRAQVGFGHQLDERGAAAVVVEEALARAADTPLRTAHVHHLGGILLHVYALDADGHHIGAIIGTHDGRLAVASHVFPNGTLAGSLPANLEVEMPVHREGHRPLCGLEVLGHVGVKVVLAVEHRATHDLAVGSDTCHDDGFYGLSVGHRKRTRHAQTNGAYVGVGWVVARDPAAAEHLGLERGELGVDLQPYHGLPFAQYLGKRLQASSPPLPANAGATRPSMPHARSRARARVSRRASANAGP